MTKPIETHPCIAHRCPFCGADAGTPCVTRNSGKEQTWPHSRRIALTQTEEERQRYAPRRVDALCCVCGNRRTINSDYSRRNDPNYYDSPAGQRGGWLHTQSLKCDHCGNRTRHALLRGECRWRDIDEERQRAALGDDTALGWSAEHLERLRRDYREKSPFPRNPNLHHRFNVDVATRAWDAGERKVVAICGEKASIHTDPRNWSKYRSKKKARRQEELYDGFVVAEQLSDIEYTDVDTGLEWIDMDCVDCCRVSNTELYTARRRRLEWFFAYFARHPELVPDHRVMEIMALIEDIFGVSDE